MHTSILRQRVDHLAEARRLLYEQEENEAVVNRLLVKYCLWSNDAYINRTGLEYVYMKEDFTQLQRLIYKNAVHPNLKNRQWAKVYQVLLDYRNRTEEPYLLLNRLRVMKTDCPELNVVIQFAKVPLYYTLNEYGYIGEITAQKKDVIQSIKDPMIRQNLYMRLQESLFIYHLKRNEVIIARKYAYKLTKYHLKPERAVRIEMNLGLSYIFETYEQGIYHLHRAKKIAKQNDLFEVYQKINDTIIPFFSAHFKRTEGISTDNTIGQAFIHIAKGEYAQAMHVLEQTPLNNPYIYYLMGLATGERDYFIRSYDCFVKRRSNFFFARLPLQELKH